LWAFWVAPLVGAVIAGGVYHVFEHEGHLNKSIVPSRA
jgi:hypothetical protein